MRPQFKPTADIPREPQLPGTRQPTRKLGVIDIIRFAIGSKANEINSMVLESTETDPKFTRLLASKRAARLLRAFLYHDKRLTKARKALTAMGLEVQQQHKAPSKLGIAYAKRNVIRNANRQVQISRGAALKVLYNAALLDTLGLDATAAGKYLRTFKKKVERI